MPSDAVSTLRDQAREALAGPAETFRSALVSSAEELRGLLDDAGATGEERARSLARELGPFAAGRIDAGRLTAILSEKGTLTEEAAAVVRRAEAVLAGAVEEGVVPLDVEVEVGGDLRDAVRDALASAGRVFGAARAAGKARSGEYRETEDARLLDTLPFRAWSAGERRLAPPVVVRVAGEDLRPAGLADFLEGGVKIVLVVEGDAPPAALARLIRPGLLVVQAAGADGLGGVGDFPGPAIAALFERAGVEGPVPFTHDPRRGHAPWERTRLGVDSAALEERLEGTRWPVRGWGDDLEHLLALATSPAPVTRGGVEGTGGGSAGADDEAAEPARDADRLAAWLLSRADLPGADPAGTEAEGA